MASLSHRERVLRALSHQEADRVPIDFGGMPTFTTIHVGAHRSLLKHLGLTGGKEEISLLAGQAVRPDRRLLERWGSDCRPLWSSGPDGFQLQIRKETDGSAWFLDEWGIRWAMPAGGLYYDTVGFPLKEATVEDLEKVRWPDPCDPGRIRGLADQARELYENTDYCLIMTPSLFTGVVAHCEQLCGFEDFFVKLLIDPEFIRRLVAVIEDFHLKQWNAILDAAGKYIQVAVMSDDLAVQKGAHFDPALYRQLFKPTHQRIVRFIKSKAPHIKVLYHCCGDALQFLPDFLDIGYDAWNPIQVSCPSLNDTARLKELYGSRITFWGEGSTRSRRSRSGPPPRCARRSAAG